MKSEHIPFLLGDCESVLRAMQHHLSLVVGCEVDVVGRRRGKEAVSARCQRCYVPIKSGKYCAGFMCKKDRKTARRASHSKGERE